MRKHIKILILSLFLACWATFGFAQVIYFPYYGKNKVIYTKFDWSHYKTDHFDIYFYTKDMKILKNIAALAESAYQRISNKIKHQLSAPVPLLYYTSTTDFAQTNLYQIPEGVLGVAEPILYRIALRGDMPLDELQNLIEHELAHIFEYDLLWGSPGGALYALASPPDWIMEGFSEYSTRTWSSWSSLIVRDAVLNDGIPELNESGNLFSSYPFPRPPDYDFGHAIFEFIEEKYGENGIREFWHSMKDSPLIKKSNPLQRVFKQTPKEFNHEFKKYIRSKMKNFLLKENPEDYSIPIGPQFPLTPYYFSFSHALSPSGDIVAVLLMNYKDQDYDIVLFSTKDGRVIKNITKGYTLKYEHIKFEIDPSMGKDIAWSPDGDHIAFFARAGEKYSLFIINALTGKTITAIKILEDQPSSPCFLPGGDEVLFTAFKNGSYDIFRINLSTKKTINLTDDDLFEKAPAISPDGKFVAYTVRLDTDDKLFLSSVNNLKKKRQLTFGSGNTITPEFSRDSKEIFFSGDMRGAFNIYSLNLETGELKRYTDVRTGNFFPSPLPNDSNEVLFSSFNKGAFQVYKSERKGEAEKTVTFVDLEPEEEFKRFEPIVTLEINKENVRPHKGIGKLYLASRPPIDTIVSTDGSIYGGSAISFSDLLGDYNFFLMAYQVRNYRSYYFAFINLKRRLQYMLSVYQYTIFYYAPLYYIDPTLYNFYTYRDAVATRKISGVTASLYYPFNRYYRTEASLGYSLYEEEFFDPYLFGRSDITNMFWNGSQFYAAFSLTGETTRFKSYGPSSGNTFQVSLIQALPISKRIIQNTTAQVDYRQYLNIGADSLLAFRFIGFASRGKNPYIFYYGGNNEVRSADFYSIIATEGWYANLEFRFPLINFASSLIGQIGPIRGTLFCDITRAKTKGFPAKFFRFAGDTNKLIASDAIGSWGYGFEIFLFGFPVHLEFVKMLEFPDISNPFDFNSIGDFQTKFWIGFDF